MFEYAEPKTIEQQDRKDWTPSYNPEFVAKVHAKRRAKVQADRERAILERRARFESSLRQSRDRARRAKRDAMMKALKKAERAQQQMDAVRERLFVVGKTEQTTDLLRFAEAEIAKFGVTVREFREDKSRRAETVAMRYALAVAMYVKFPDASLPRIGKILGLHHTTVMHSVKKAGVWRNPGRPGSTTGK